MRAHALIIGGAKRSKGCGVSEEDYIAESRIRLDGWQVRVVFIAPKSHVISVHGRVVDIRGVLEHGVRNMGEVDYLFPTLAGLGPASVPLPHRSMRIAPFGLVVLDKSGKPIYDLFV
jgi:hypothetical protein